MNRSSPDLEAIDFVVFNSCKNKRHKEVRYFKEHYKEPSIFTVFLERDLYRIFVRGIKNG